MAVADIHVNKHVLGTPPPPPFQDVCVCVGESVRATLMSNQAHKLRKTLNLFNEACSTGRGSDKCIWGKLINVATSAFRLFLPQETSPPFAIFFTPFFCFCCENSSHGDDALNWQLFNSRHKMWHVGPGCVAIAINRFGL